MSPELFDAARARLADTGLDAPAQTKISTFVHTAKQLNASLLGGFAWMPITHPAQAFAHSQVFRETEAASLLWRTTRWSMDPAVLLEASVLALPLWTEFASCRPAPWPNGPRAALPALALGHALLGQIRLTPCIPAGLDGRDPYVLAMQRVDTDNGRLMQLQTRLLAHAAHEVPDAQAIVDARQQAVSKAYGALLASLARL